MPVPPGHACTVKGAAVTSTLDYVTRQFGLSSLHRIVKEIGGPYRDLLDVDLLLGAPHVEDMPVPVRFLVDVMELVGGRYLAEDGGALALAERLGRNGAYASQPVLRRLVIHALTPEAIVVRAADVWSYYYSCGTCTGTLTAPKEGKVVVEGLHDAHPVWCRRITGYLRELVTRSSGRQANVVEVHCATRGEPRCEWLGDWGGPRAL